MIIKRILALLLALTLAAGLALAEPEGLCFSVQVEPKQAAELLSGSELDADTVKLAAELLNLCTVNITKDAQAMRASLLVNGKEIVHISETSLGDGDSVLTSDMLPGIGLVMASSPAWTDADVAELSRRIQELPSTVAAWAKKIPCTEERGTFYSTYVTAPLRRTYALNDRDLNVLLQDVIYELSHSALGEYGAIWDASAWLDSVFAYDNADRYELQVLCSELGQPLGFILRAFAWDKEAAVLSARLGEAPEAMLILMDAGVVLEAFQTPDTETESISVNGYVLETMEPFFGSRIYIPSALGRLVIGTGVTLPGILSYADETVIDKDGLRYTLVLEGKDKPLLTFKIGTATPAALTPDAYETTLTLDQIDTPAGSRQVMEALKSGYSGLTKRLLKAVPPLMLLKLMKWGIFN